MLARKFSTLSQIFLKRFVTEKKLSDSFCQIYLEYLQQLNNNKMIVYGRDKTIVANPNLNLKFVSMFLDKFVASFKNAPLGKDRAATSRNKKMEIGIIDLQFKMAIHTANSA